MRPSQVTRIDPRSQPSSSGIDALEADLTSREWSRIVAKIRPDFTDTVAAFETDKYPPDVYEKVGAAFRNPTRVSKDDLRNALLWKFGHLRKTGRIPGAHERLIAELQRRWSRLAFDLPRSPDLAFAFLEERIGGATRFITVAFLVHLLHQEQIPIIDQNNFRAVNSFLREVRPSWSGKKKPSKFADVHLVAAFMAGVLAAWSREDGPTVPSPRELDQFLMVYGKSLKQRHSQRFQPTAAGAIMSRRG